MKRQEDWKFIVKRLMGRTGLKMREFSSPTIQRFLHTVTLSVEV